MKPFAVAIVALSLALWAVIGSRIDIPATPGESARLPLNLNADTQQVLKQLDWVRQSLSDSRETAISPNRQRRLLDEARGLLDIARQRIVADQLAAQRKLDDGLRALRESNTKLQNEWGRLLAQSAREHDRRLENSRFHLSMAEKKAPRRYVIVDRAPVPSANLGLDES